MRSPTDITCWQHLHVCGTSATKLIFSIATVSDHYSHPSRIYNPATNFMRPLAVLRLTLLSPRFAPPQHQQWLLPSDTPTRFAEELQTVAL